MGKKQYLLTVVLAVVAGFVGGIGSSWFLMGSPVFAQKTPEPAKVIQADKFEVVDKDGNARAWFGMTNDGEPNLTLIGKDGATRAGLYLSGEEPYLSLYDKNPKSRTTLSHSGLGIGDQKSRATLSHSGLGIGDQNEKPRAALLLSHGQPGLTLYDENGKNRSILGLTDGMPALLLSDKDGKDRAMLGLPDGEPHLVLFGEDEKVMWDAP